MRNIEKYYDNTESENPRNNVQYFIDKIKCNPSNAIELGCGAGNDTVYLIKNNWNVLAIDREDVEERISNRLNPKEIEKDALTGLGKMKHWHIFDVIAKKRILKLKS